MKLFFFALAVAVGALFVVACNNQPMQRVDVPSATDPATYQPQPYPKPMPPAGYDPGMQQPNPTPTQPMAPAPAASMPGQ